MNQPRPQLAGGGRRPGPRFLSRSRAASASPAAFPSSAPFRNMLQASSFFNYFNVDMNISAAPGRAVRSSTPASARAQAPRSSGDAGLSRSEAPRSPLMILRRITPPVRNQFRNHFTFLHTPSELRIENRPPPEHYEGLANRRACVDSAAWMWGLSQHHESKPQPYTKATVNRTAISFVLVDSRTFGSGDIASPQSITSKGTLTKGNLCRTPISMTYELALSLHITVSSNQQAPPIRHLRTLLP